MSASWALEFHDSQVDSIQWSRDECRIHFNKLWLHKRASDQDPRESGWNQKALLVVSGVSMPNEKTGNGIRFPTRIENGTLTVDNTPYGNCVILPLSFSGGIKIEFDFYEESKSMMVFGKNIRIELEGKPEFIEYCRHPDTIFKNGIK